MEVPQQPLHQAQMQPPFQPKRAPDMIAMQLTAELQRMDPSLVTIHRLVLDEVDRRTNRGEPDYLEVDIPRKIKIAKKILVPIHRNPEFNFIGKLMGPGGSTLKKLQEKLNCRIYVAGRGSSKDIQNEQMLLASGDPRHRHLADELHVKVEVLGTPVEAFRKMADALEEIKDHFNPDLDDHISAAQKAEGFTPTEPGAGRARFTNPSMGYRPRGRGAYGRGMTPGYPMRGPPPVVGASATGSYMPMRPSAPGAYPPATQNPYYPYPGVDYSSNPDLAALYASGYANGAYWPTAPTAAVAGSGVAGGIQAAVPGAIPANGTGAVAGTAYGAASAGKFWPAAATRGAYRAHPYASGAVVDQAGAGDASAVAAAAVSY